MFKTTDTKTSARTSSKNKGQPFFSKEGEHSFFSSKESKAEEPFFVQAKLTVGQPNDKYEQEADAMADTVVRRLSENNPQVTNKNENSVQAKPIAPFTTISPFVQTKCTACDQEEKMQKKEKEGEQELLIDKLQKKPIFESNAEPPDDENNVQRKCAQCENEDEKKLQTRSENNSPQTAEPSLESNLSSSKGGGTPLPKNTQTQMESSFGADFSNVRIHNGSSAVQMSKDLNAHAFTHGSDIYFNSGKYDAKNKSGKHLLAHELTHVVQQTGSLKSIPEIQKWPWSTDTRTADEKIKAALKSRDAGDVKAIKGEEINRATEAQKIELIEILAYQGWTSWTGTRDEWKIEEIWGSFGDQIPRLMKNKRELWGDSIKKGADLDELDAVKKVREIFKEDVNDKASEYLKQNKDYVLQEMQSLGVLQICLPNQKEPTKEEQDARLQEIRDVTAKVAEAQEQERQLRNIVVGRMLLQSADPSHASIIPVYTDMTFDPEKKPDKELTQEDIQNKKGRSWQEVFEKWKAPSAVITKAANLYPAIYAAIQASQPGIFEGPNDVENKISTIADEKNPELARLIIANVLKGQLANIEKAEQTLQKEHKPAYYKFDPIHKQLFAGLMSMSGTDWKDEFNQWAANQDLKANKDRDFWTDLTLSTAAAAAFIIIEFATAGSATFFLAAGVGLAASGAKTAMAWDDYVNLANAAKTNVKDETALVDRKQVIEAGHKAMAATAEFIAMLAAVGVKGISGLTRKSLNQPEIPKGEASAGAANFMDKKDQFYKNASKRADIDPQGVVDVIAHGTPNQIEILTAKGPVLVDHRVASKLIKNTPGYSGQPVRLLSCETGSCDSGFAQNLANKMGIPVNAPTDTLWAYDNGRMIVAARKSLDSTSPLYHEPDLSKQGTFRTFVPKQSP